MTRYIFFTLISLWSFFIVNLDGQDLSHSIKSALDEGLQEHLKTPFTQSVMFHRMIKWLKEVRLNSLLCHLKIVNVIKYVHS